MKTEKRSKAGKNLPSTNTYQPSGKKRDNLETRERKTPPPKAKTKS
jgi:hypothetical protein